MRRREFIAFTCAVAAWPLTARAQTMPVVGLLASWSPDAPSGPVSAIHLGLRQAGFEVGKAVRMEPRYAHNQLERLPALAAELIEIPAAVIVTSGGLPPILALKAATATIPIVFSPVSDPVRNGLVASMNRPGGNITGVAALTVELDPKRLQLLHDLVGGDAPLGVLVNPTRPDIQAQIESINTAARSIGREVVLREAKDVAEFEATFSALAQRSVAGVLVGADPYFSTQKLHIVGQAARHRLPAIYQWREFADGGGLASYGPSIFDGFRQVGLFAARILKGEKAADLPVQQPTKFEFIINLKTARSLGLDVPATLLARADEVIE